MQETLRPEWPHYCRYHPDFSNAEGPNKTVSASPKMDRIVIEHLKNQDLKTLTDYGKNEIAWTFVPQQDGSYFIRPKEGSDDASTCRTDGQFCVHTHVNMRDRKISRNIFGNGDDQTVKAGMPNYMVNPRLDIWVKDYFKGDGYVDRYLRNVKNFAK